MKLKKLIITIIISMFFIVNLFTEEIKSKKYAEWADGAIGYQIFFRSFFDSDGDGIGDFKGVTSKLDYLNDGKPGGNDLGVDFIWFTPVFKSGSFHGYDVKDYYTLEPKFGTMDDFQELLDEAKKRGIKILMDYVINHSSENHAFFQEALNNTNSPKRDWYIFKDKPTTWPIWDNIPQPFSKGNNNDYYWCTFGRNPDWNLKNPEVTEYFYDIAKFWLKKGVDGFRLDAARHFIEEEIDGKIVSVHAPSTLKWLKEFTQFVHKDYPDALILGEIWDEPENIGQYTHPDKGGISATFNFPVRYAMIDAFIEGKGAKFFGDAVAYSKSFHHQNTIDVVFSGNHDIKRLASLVKDQEMLKLFAKLIVLTPGTPMIYYGDELGMQVAKNSSGDTTYRTIFSWSDEPNAGFTKGKKAKALFSPEWEKRNVKKELENKKSLLNVYKNMIQLKKSLPGYAKGKFVGHDSTETLYKFFVDGEDHDYYVVINSTSKTQNVSIKANNFPAEFNITKNSTITLKEVSSKFSKSIKLDTSKSKKLSKIKSYEAKIYEVVR